MASPDDRHSYPNPAFGIARSHDAAEEGQPAPFKPPNDRDGTVAPKCEHSGARQKTRLPGARRRPIPWDSWCRKCTWECPNPHWTACRSWAQRRAHCRCQARSTWASLRSPPDRCHGRRYVSREAPSAPAQGSPPHWRTPWDRFKVRTEQSEPLLGWDLSLLWWDFFFFCAFSYYPDILFKIQSHHSHKFCHYTMGPQGLTY